MRKWGKKWVQVSRDSLARLLKLLRKMGISELVSIIINIFFLKNLSILAYIKNTKFFARKKFWKATHWLTEIFFLHLIVTLHKRIVVNLVFNQKPLIIIPLTHCTQLLFIHQTIFVLYPMEEQNLFSLNIVPCKICTVHISYYGKITQFIISTNIWLGICIFKNHARNNPVKNPQCVIFTHPM